MTECSQKFKDMLTSFYAEAYDDGKFQCELSDPALEKEHAILEYVAELEAAKRSLVIRGYTYHGGEVWKPPLGEAPAFLGMTGGMP